MVDIAANSSLGIRMYLLNESLFHRPRDWIVESATPLAAATLAAPIRNECPEKREASIPAAESVDLSHDTSALLDSGDPSSCMKSGPV